MDGSIRLTDWKSSRSCGFPFDGEVTRESGAKTEETNGGRIELSDGSHTTDGDGGGGVGAGKDTDTGRGTKAFLESGETTELIPAHGPSHYESDSDDSSATTYWQSSPKCSSKSSTTNSPLRHLLRKSPKPIAAVTPLRKQATEGHFKKCSSRTARLKRKLKEKTALSEKDCGCSKQKAFAQRILHDYFKVKKRKKHYKRKTEKLQSKLAEQELQFKEPDPEGADADAGFDAQMFKENISEKLSTCLKNQFGRDVLAYAKHQSDLIGYRIWMSSPMMSQHVITSQCGCLLFDDEVHSNSQSQRTTQSTGPLQRSRQQLVSQRQTSSQRFSHSLSQQSPQSQKSTPLPTVDRFRPFSQQFSQFQSPQSRESSQSSSQLQLFSQPPRNTLDFWASHRRVPHSLAEYLENIPVGSIGPQI